MPAAGEEIVVINPGSTSTKTAVWLGEAMQAEGTIRHPAAILQQYRSLPDQFPYRFQAVAGWLEGRASGPAAVVTLGGLLRPVPGGTYRISSAMMEDARAGVQGQHASNLGCLLAAEIASRNGALPLAVDPVSVDEFAPLARYSGHPELPRRSLSHALNIHAVARAIAAEIGIPYPASHFVVAHLGGGISVAPVRGGRIIDANDAASGGPFSPERTGTLPVQGLVTLCFSGRTEQEIRKMVMGEGGLVAYCGTNDAAEVEKRINAGDAAAREVYEAMAYQIAKEIGAMAAVLGGRMHGVILTGGLASSSMLTEWIRARISFLGPVYVVPGENEMEALAGAALRALRGEDPIMEYPSCS